MKTPYKLIRNNKKPSRHKDCEILAVKIKTLLKDLFYKYINLKKNTNDTDFLMEEKEKSNKDEESPKEEIKTRDKIINNTQDAGPSRVVNLPGAIQHSPRNFITGRSKSEHSIKPYITSADVANALKITSLSFGNQNQTTDRELKIPMLDKNDDKEDAITFIELKKLMASCFKISKDTNEIANVNVHTAISGITNDLVHSIPNVSLNKTDVNDVVVTQDSRSNRASEGRKKNSGNLSEKSDLLAQRDSLSSIGSNVCRICMTRGKERYIHTLYNK